MAASTPGFTQLSAHPQRALRLSGGILSYLNQSETMHDSNAEHTEDAQRVEITI
jgi:hypothetical protein